MFQDDYRRRMDAVIPDPELLARTKNRMEAAGSGARPPRRLTRRGAAALVVCAALVVSAAAAGPTIWQAIRSDLGGRAPYAVEVEAVCEDQGIRIEAQAALADSRITRLYFTMQDLTGEIFRDDTSCDLILSLETCGEFDWGNGGIGLEVLEEEGVIGLAHTLVKTEKKFEELAGNFRVLAGELEGAAARLEWDQMPGLFRQPAGTGP